MAMLVQTNPLEAAYAALLNEGLDGAGGALRILVNEASKIERAQHLNAHQACERSGERSATPMASSQVGRSKPGYR